MFLYHFSKNDDDKRLKSEILGFDNVSSECLNFEECSHNLQPLSALYKHTHDS